LFLYLKTETEPAPKMWCFYKKVDDTTSPKRNDDVTSFVLCSLIFDFLTFEDGTNKLSRNISKELLLNAA
jgi:hypothetical protein